MINYSVNYDSLVESNMSNTLQNASIENSKNMKKDLSLISQMSGELTQVFNERLKNSNNEDFVPQYDKYNQGSELHSQYQSYKRKSMQNKMIKQVTENCMKLIEKNTSELDQYFNQIFHESKTQEYLQNVEIGIVSANNLPIRININDILDSDGFTLIHMAAFKNKTKMFNLIVQRAKQELSEQEMYQWINKQTSKDKFTALHYASFRGNIEIIECLIENKADINLKNQYGLNVLHIAAQGDQPISLYYFKQKNMDLDSKDKRGSTPLHWACFQSSEISLLYLLEWLDKDQIDLQDQDGYTAVHLAIKTAESLKSGRPLRALLQHGANKNSKSKKGHSPLDLVQEIQSEALKRELISNLQDKQSCGCLMLKPSLKKTGKSLKMPLLFLIFFDFIFAVLITCLFAEWKYSEIVVFNIVCGSITLLFWGVTAVSDPGFIRKPEEVDFLNLLKMVDPIQLCPSCLVVRTPRSRHCATCNKCVERYDHHCPWVNNCIGVKNHGYFMVFLIFLFLTIIGVFFSSIYGLVYVLNDNTNFQNNNGIFQKFIPDDLEIKKHIFIAASCFSIFFTLCCLIPVFLLVFIQIKNFCLNRTTNERFSKKKLSSRRASSNVSSFNETERSDSTGSSFMNQLLAEDIIKQIGDPEDFKERKCVCLHNQIAMWFPNKDQHQLRIYYELLKNTKSGMNIIKQDDSLKDFGNNSIKNKNHSSQNDNIEGGSGSTISIADEDEIDTNKSNSKIQ